MLFYRSRRGRRRTASDAPLRFHRVEALEPRTLLASFVVTGIDNTGAGSLRQAILDANNAPGQDFITFNIPGPGPHTISPAPIGGDPLSAPMPITDSVVIDAYSQPGAVANSLAVGSNADLRIRLDGATAGAGVAGLFIDNARNVVLRGFSITGFEDGIIIRGGGNNLVEGNYIGLAPTGTPAANRGYGVSIEGADQNRIGGNTAAGRNVISSNGNAGIRLTRTASVNNSIRNNYIGTDPTGTLDRGNNAAGIEVTAFNVAQGYASQTVIGGTSAELRNVISGNAGPGIALIGAPAKQNVIRGNYIGTNAAGDAAVPNDLFGVLVTLPVGQFGALSGSSTDNVIGGAEAGAGNVISGNKRSGIFLIGTAHRNTIQGNYIGTDATGTADLGNLEDGILLRDAASLGVGGPVGNTIGGKAPAAGNVISGNDGNGVNVSGATTIDNAIQGNRIGAGATNAPRKNNGHGILLDNGAAGNLVGDDDTPGNLAPGGNVIAHNGGHGVVVVNGTLNPIRRNSIFLNTRRGIDLGNDSFTVNDFGDADAGANNLQDCPVVTDVAFGPGIKTIEWTLNSAPGTDFIIDIFSNSEPDPSGFGEGGTYLRSVNVRTNASGNAIFIEAFDLTDRYVSATATDSDGNTSEFSMVDTDGDALGDGWEINGININEDATTDLFLINSDPNKKDLYVEPDAMADFVPPQGALNLVAAAFALAPGALVQNPDGSDGITLHATLDEIDITSAPWDDPWDGLDGIKAVHFGTTLERTGTNSANVLAAKALAYRYMVFADKFLGESYSGAGELPGYELDRADPAVEPHGGNDFAVTLGTLWLTNPGVTPNMQAGTFMHELGHTLGLGHGGDDGLQFKPNYHSVMNYTWQMPARPPAPPPNPPPAPTALQTAYINSWGLDYSRVKFPDLDEDHLNEGAGIGGHAGHVLRLGPPRVQVLVKESGPVDWNQTDADSDGDRDNDANVVADINYDRAQSLLRGFEDWSQLRYYFREVSATAGRAHGEALQEMKAEEYANLMPRDGPLAGRYIFYNRSIFDGNDAAPGVADDAAIAADKAALLASDTATFDNISSYSRGINGVMMDLLPPPAPAQPPEAQDFVLKIGDGVIGWRTLAQAPQVTLRPGAGASGTDRVTLVLPDNAVRNTWLQVTVLATPRTGLTAPHTFYFGHLAGKTGGPNAWAVDTRDMAAVRATFGTTGAGVTHPADFNRDRVVNAFDLLAARDNLRRGLRLLTAPEAPSAATTTLTSAVPPPGRDSRQAAPLARRRAWEELTPAPWA